MTDGVAKKNGAGAAARQVIVHICVWLTVFFVMFPLLMTLVFSLKNTNDFTRGFWALPSSLAFGNYAYGFRIMGLNMLNSIVTGAITAFAAVFVSSLTAYVFSRYEFTGKNFLFSIIIALMMVPGILTLTPSFMNVLNLRLNNTWFAVILPGIAANIVGGVFLFKTFMSQQPKDLYESARVEGAGDMTMYFKIAIPLSVPVLIIQLIGVFSGQYNDYLWPLLVIENQQRQMLMPILKGGISNLYDENLNKGIEYAVYICSGIPLIITSAVGLKYFINGDFASGLKL
ncbi:sugar ABC transporter permease [Clostridia bacterium]|nr:sugar ABC transporter permease [Clostridia bacterium]